MAASPDRSRRNSFWSGAIVLVAMTYASGAGVARADTYLSSTVKDSSVTLGANRTEVTFGSNDVAAAVRSESGIPAGSGAYYFEVERLQPNGEYGLGFGPGSAPLNSTFASTSGVLSFMVCCSYQNGTESVRYVEGFPTHYGVVVDYTGEFPILHFLHLQETTSTAPGVSFSYPMEDHEGPLYLYAFGSGYAGSAVMRINFGNDLTSNPFSYDPVTTMDARYYRAGEGLTLHWYDATRIAPTVTPTRDHVAGVLGTAVTLSATATDPQDGNVVSQLVWRDGGGVVVGRGASVSFSSTSTGAKVMTASVADSSQYDSSNTAAPSNASPRQTV